MTKRYIAVVVECADDEALAAIQSKGEAFLPRVVDEALLLVPNTRVLRGVAHYSPYDKDERPGRWTRIDEIGRAERASERAMRLAAEQREGGTS